MILTDLTTLRRVDTDADEWWVREIQESLGLLVVDEDWGPKTKRRYTQVYGAPAEYTGGYPIPRLYYKWGYHHADGWPLHSPEWEKFTEPNTWLNGMLRLVSGRRNGGWYSRTPGSVVSLDTFSFGIAHWWSERLQKVLPAMCLSTPGGFLERVVGVEMAEKMRTPVYYRQMFNAKKIHLGHVSFRAKHVPLLRTLTALSSHRMWILAQCNFWYGDTVPKALKIIHEETSWDLTGPDGGRLMAGVCRMVNSSPGGARKRVRKYAGSRGQTPLGCLAVAMCDRKSNGGYGHPERWATIAAESRFEGGWK